MESPHPEGCPPTPRGPWGCHLRVLHHDVLVRDEAVDAVVPPLPPVVGGALVEQQRGPLLEGQLPGRPAHVVKPGYGLDGLAFWGREKGKTTVH